MNCNEKGQCKSSMICIDLIFMLGGLVRCYNIASVTVKNHS